MQNDIILTFLTTGLEKGREEHRAKGQWSLLTRPIGPQLDTRPPSLTLRAVPFYRRASSNSYQHLFWLQPRGAPLSLWNTFPCGPTLLFHTQTRGAEVPSAVLCVAPGPSRTEAVLKGAPPPHPVKEIRKSHPSPNPLGPRSSAVGAESASAYLCRVSGDPRSQTLSLPCVCGMLCLFPSNRYQAGRKDNPQHLI